MTSPDRPAPARRRATAAPDEAAGANPIDPPAPTVTAVSRPKKPAQKKVTYAQLNVRLTSDEWAQFEAIQDHEGLGQVETVRQLIAEAMASRGL